MSAGSVDVFTTAARAARAATTAGSFLNAVLAARTEVLNALFAALIAALSAFLAVCSAGLDEECQP